MLFISDFRINDHSLKLLKEVRKHAKAFYVGTDPDLSKLNSIDTDRLNTWSNSVWFNFTLLHLIVAYVASGFFLNRFLITHV